MVSKALALPPPSPPPPPRPPPLLHLQMQNIEKTKHQPLSTLNQQRTALSQSTRQFILLRYTQSGLAREFLFVVFVCPFCKINSLQSHLHCIDEQYSHTLTSRMSERNRRNVRDETMEHIAHIERDGVNGKMRDRE